MTRTGANRNRYANQHATTDPRPSRFTNDGQDYTAWAARADAWAELNPATFLPDLPDKVHGLVSLTPPTVQCDGCGHRYSRDSLWLTVVTSHIIFNPRTDVTDQRRMCADCWRDAGWVDENLRGFRRVETAEVGA